ncbi:MAG: DUF4331 family protein [Planctomycetes bacterium]|nr:DUF4331 family protein [Planctomycetota bacterium]
MRIYLPGTALAVALVIPFITGCGGDDNDNDNDSPAPSTDFAFSPLATSSYTRIDRQAMPVVNTAVITSKDAYNAANPATDGTEPFITEIGTNVAAYHTALDAELMALNLDPATNEQSLAQAGPLIIPDVLRVNPAVATGFPNGRLLSDPTPDVMLAVVLLDLGHPGQSATTFADLPLNPAANDKAFLTAFPYLATPHTP